MFRPAVFQAARKRTAEALIELLSLPALYQILIVRPCLSFAKALWFSVGTEVWLEKFPRAVQRLAQNIQKRQNGQVSSFFIAVLIGLFLLSIASVGMKG